MRLALFQPDIAPNAGTIFRLGACLGVPVDVIEPCGFPLSDRSLKRAGLDYLDQAEITRHADWEAFVGAVRPKNRLLLLTTHGSEPYTGFAFRDTDILILGRESAGVPESVHKAVDARLVIPMKPGLRSLNVAVAGAIVLGEALRQTGGFPTFQESP